MTAKIEHGTRAGYQRHTIQGVTPCDPCRKANRDYQALLYKQNPAPQRARAAARYRALARLARRYPDDYQALLSEEAGGPR